jgi:hypothetical protein
MDIEKMNREIPNGRRSRRRARFIAATADLSARPSIPRYIFSIPLIPHKKQLEGKLYDNNYR